MLNPAKLLEAVGLSHDLVAKDTQSWNGQIRINDVEGHMVGLAYPLKDSDGIQIGWEVEAYPVGGSVGILDWDNLAEAKLYCAAKQLGHWDDLAELHPSNRKDS